MSILNGLISHFRKERKKKKGTTHGSKCTTRRIVKFTKSEKREKVKERKD